MQRGSDSRPEATVTTSQTNESERTKRNFPLTKKHKQCNAGERERVKKRGVIKHKTAAEAGKSGGSFGE